MGLNLVINGGTYTSDLDKLDWEAGGKAQNGERSVGKLYVFDEAAAITSLHAFSLKQWSLTENASGTAVYLARGRVMQAEGQRDDTKGVTLVDDNAVVLTTEDQNSELIGITLTSAWERSEETDYARVIALAGDFLDGSYRTSTNLATTYVQNASTVTMPAKTYPAGTPVIEILAECAAEADKLFFVTVDHELFYAKDTSSIYDSTLTISDNVSTHTDVNNTSVFAPIWNLGPALTANAQDAVSGFVASWADGKSVLVEDAAIESSYDKWIMPLNVDEADTRAEAEDIATGILAYRSRLERTYAVTIKLRNTQVHLIKPGQRIAIESYAARTSGAVNKRIAELKWKPVADGTWYEAQLFLERTIPMGRRGSGGRAKPKPAPAATPPSSSALHLWTAEDGGEDIAWNSIATNDGPGQIQGAKCYPTSGSSTRQDSWAATAGTTYRIAGFITSSLAGQSGGPPPGGELHLVFLSESAGLDGSLAGTPLATELLATASAGWTEFTSDLTAPTGTNSARLVRSSTPAFHFDYVSVHEVTAGETPDEHAVNYGDCPHDSPHFLPSDYVECRLSNLQEQVSSVEASKNWTRIVAASDTPTEMASGADYICDGTADETEINQAITDVGNDSGPPGSVLLLPGTYYITAAIDFQPWDTTAVTDSRHVFEATAARIHAAGNLTQMVKVNGVSVAAGYFLNRFDIRIGSLNGVSGTYTVSRAFEMKRASDNHVWIGNITFVSGDGFYVDQDGVSDTGTFNNFIEINRITDVAGIAFRVIGGDNIHGFQGNIIKTGQIWNCGTGFSMGQAANKNAQYNTIIAAPIEHNGYGIIDRGGGNTWIVNNTNSNTTYGISVATGITRRSTFQFTSDAETIDPNVYAEHYVLEYGVFKGLVEFVEKSSAPGTPSSGVMRVYGKTDGKLYLKNDAGTEYDLTGGMTEAELQDAGHYELLMAEGTSPVEPLETGDGTDWLYVWVPG